MGLKPGDEESEFANFGEDGTDGGEMDGWGVTEGSDM